MSLSQRGSSGTASLPDYPEHHSGSEHSNRRESFHYCGIQASLPIFQFAQYDFPPVWLEFLIEGALRFPDGVSWPHPLPDPDDARFLSLAKTTGAWFITGNLKHYPAKSREDVIVRTPAEYVAILDEAS
jgi:hypothetical protein